jgi:hypothetical protein
MQTNVKFVLLAALVNTSCIPNVFAAETGLLEQMAQASWRHDIAQIAAPADGCYHAIYPSIVWQRVECQLSPSSNTIVPRQPMFTRDQAASDITGYALGASSIISKAVGSFPIYSGITSLTNYLLEMNTGIYTTAACNGHAGCTAWQQFMYAPDYVTTGQADVFMQDWLIDYGSGRCPTGFESDGEGDCYKNSALVALSDISPKDLGGATLTGTATTGGNDTAVLTYAGDAYSTSQKDSSLDLASVWKDVEYNIFGGNGQEAEFNSSGVSITVNIAATDGSKAAPTCEAETGGTPINNLVLGSCTASGVSTPSISFKESD